MKKIILIFITTFFFINCQGQSKNNLSCNDESKAIKIISELKEVKKQQEYILSITNNKKGVSFIVENEKIKNEDYFVIKTGFNGELRWEAYTIYYLSKADCGKIYVEDVIKGKKVSLQDWRKIKKTNSKNMKTKKELFGDLFNESSNIKFMPSNLKDNKDEIKEFNKNLKLFEDQNPDANDFDFDNLRILINNETFTNSEMFINSSWLEYFINKYKIDTKSLNELMSLAIIQEDLNAVKTMLKHGYIVSLTEIDEANEQLKYFKSLKGKVDLKEYYDPAESKIEKINPILIKSYKLNKIKDPDGFSNLRKEKNKTSDVLEKINSGETIEVLDNKGDWFLVKTKQNHKGYVNKTRIVSE